MIVLGVIPARGGSKGIPQKNLQRLAGRPLLAYTAEAALGSRCLGRVVISTDDSRIAAAARDLGLEVPFMRPAELAGDAVSMLPVLEHAVAEMAAQACHAEVVVLLQPTSPLRRSEHIDRAVELLLSSGADSVVTVVEVPHQFNPGSVMRLVGDRLVPFLGESTAVRRQDKQLVFARNGPAVLVVKTSVLEAGSLYGSDCRPLIMSAEESIDIDGPADLRYAEYLLSQKAPPS